MAGSEPDNEDARYYEYAQRVYCGEAKACWQNFVTTGASIPPPRGCFNIAMVPSASGRLLPVSGMMIEARELVNDQGKQLLYVPATAPVRVFIYTKYSAMKNSCAGAFTGRDGFAQRT